MSTITLFEQAQLAEAAYAQNQWGQTPLICCWGKKLSLMKHFQ